MLGDAITRRIGAIFLVLAVVAGGGTFAYELGWFRFSYPSPARFPVRGIDVSHHQGPIDWKALSAHGVGFAFIKSTEGATWADPRFTANWQGASAAGVAWAPYHFFTFCTPGADQAAHFAAVASRPPRAFPPAIDIEFVGNCQGWISLGAIRAELGTFLEIVEKDFGQRPVLYVTRRTQQELLGPHFPGHPRWPRSIFGEPSASTFGAWSFWQFADNARLPGVSGPVDLNVYCCSEALFPGTSAP